MSTILLVDDHAIVREGFKRLLDGDRALRVVAEAETSREAPALAQAARPDVVVLDVSLGKGESGLLLPGQLAQLRPKMLCVVLSMHDDPGMVVRALESGARGYVTKATAAHELVEILHRVIGGEQVLSSDLSPSSQRPHGQPQLSAHARRHPLRSCTQGHCRRPRHQRQDTLPPPRQPDGEAGRTQCD